MPATPSGLTIVQWQQFTSLPRRNRPLYREGGRKGSSFFYTVLPTQTPPAGMRGHVDGQTISVFSVCNKLVRPMPHKMPPAGRVCPTFEI